MTSPQQLPYDWIRTLTAELVGIDQLTMGAAPPFPWKDFGDYLADNLQCDRLRIAAPAVEWRTQAEALQGVANPIALKFTASGTPGAVWLLVGKNEIIELIAALLQTPDLVKNLPQIDASYLEGFYLFIALQLLQSLKAFQFDQSIPYTFEGVAPLAEEAFLCLDCWVELPGVKFLSRIAVGTSFHKGWQQRYTLSPRDLLLYAPGAEQILTTVHLEAGKVAISQELWRQLELGDVLLLDSCTIQPDFAKAKVLLTVRGTPMYRARLKKGSLKILEFPLILNASDDMSDEYDEDDTYSDMDFDDHLSEDLSEDGNEQDEEALNHSDAHRHATAEEQHADATGLATPAAAEGGSKFVAVEDIPLTITLELGRIQMSVHQLVALQPGNILELDINPEEGVDLAVAGKKIARAELIRIGDHFGARIIEKG